MTADQAGKIMLCMPTDKERKSLRDYMNKSKDIKRLCECEKFMVAMMEVEHSELKICALLFKLEGLEPIDDLTRGEY
jgi:hypothetical protein